MNLINNILLTIGLWLWVWNAYILIFNKGIPNIRTAPAVRRTVIGLLQADMAARGKKPFVIIDLGSGNGLFARQIARSMPEAQVIGIEISQLAHGWAQLLKRLSRLKNLEYRQGDMFAADLSQVDAVVFYLRVYFMKRMGEKLHAELKPGTLITSNHFKLGDGWVPENTIDVRTLYPHQKTFFVYRK